MKILKYTLLSCFIFFCSVSLAQKNNQDSLLQLKKIERIDSMASNFDTTIWWMDTKFDESPEGYIPQDNDIKLRKQLIYDVKQSLYSLVSGKICTYYVNGNNTVFMQAETHKFMQEEYHIVLEYTNCKPSKYQLLYSKLFAIHYKDVFGTDINYIIFNYDRTVHKKVLETFKKKRK
jgi:hypothetical protein